MRGFSVAFAVLVLFHGDVAVFAEAKNPLVFERDIRPILRAHCLDCHGATSELSGGLDLRLVRFQQKGGDSGPAFVAGQAAGSLLVERIKSGDMPPSGAKVPAHEVELLERWIAEGARTLRPEPETLPPGLGITPEERSWWAFQPIRRPDTPTVSNSAQVQTPIDAFVLAKLEPHGLAMNPSADRATLIRRAYFDLIGLAPTADEVTAFVNDSSPDAWQSLIDRLLESPHYGERWGRHWLDVVGYADSEGMTQDDRARPYAYKYRDYVIRSLAQDKPFDRFLVEQMAGDELVPAERRNLTPEQIELLVATGYLRMAADGTAGGGIDQDLARNQVVSDTIKIVSTSLLGLSVGCAQCHDHRYDPIPQTDYYALRAVFEPSLNWKTWLNPEQRRVSLYTDEDRAKAAAVEQEVATVAEERATKQTAYIAEALEKELEKHPEELRDTLRTAVQTPVAQRTDEQKQLLKERPSADISPGTLYQYNQAAADELKKIDERIAEIRQKKPVEDFVRALTEPVNNIAPTFLFHRGDHRQPQALIEPADLQVAAPEGETFHVPSDDPNLATSGRRLAYATWLTNGRHPLLARVLVNRFWMHHFGEGIVRTPGDFGRLGELPSHPELLDWLAEEFMAQGWSLKAFHRMVMRSYVYQQASTRRPEHDAVDADNRLLGRMAVRRLEAEIVRDRLLQASGVLDRTPFGPAVPVMVDDTGLVVVKDEVPRRSVYVEQKRSQPVLMLTAFDAPVMDVNCDRRTFSTVAGQSLLMMNNSQVIARTQAMAERLLGQAASATQPELPADLLARLVPAPNPWRYGYGGYNAEAQRTHAFHPFEVYSEERWQGGTALPSETTGWSMLRREGGHTGANPDFAPIRRWISPAKGSVSISGVLNHPGMAGDGVRGRIVSDRRGLLGEWPVYNQQVGTDISALEIEAGETIDFITDCRENETTDSFVWTVKVAMAANGNEFTYDSATDFQGSQEETLPPTAPVIELAWRDIYSRNPSGDERQMAAEFLAEQLLGLSRAIGSDGKRLSARDQQVRAVAMLCQQLIASNEFLYVD